jgi:transcriptional regulator with XRE-family HTH domain
MAKKTGRPSSYNKKYDRIAYQMCLLGATDKQIAEAFGVTEQTVNNWKKDEKGNPTSFFESLKKGKVQADAIVADSLYQRAIGYSHPEDKIFNNDGEPLIVPTIRHYPPDTTAIIFWLKNRQPALWRDRQEIEATVSTGIDINAMIEKARRDISDT